MEEEDISEEQYYCTECKRTVKEEDKVCPYCGADLSEVVETEENVSDDKKTGEVVVKDFMNEIDAQLAKETLESEGIECFIVSSDGSSGMLPSMQLSYEAKLIVNGCDYERAVEVLKAMEMF